MAGQCNNDWAKFSKERSANPYTGPGTHASISSNRISYSLGLRGASASVDTACSSSLVALDIACQKLGLGMLAALMTGVQLNLIAEPFVAFSQARMLSPDGRCKTFDASANGYVRGEGCGSALLQIAAGETAGAWAPLPVIASTSTNQAQGCAPCFLLNRATRILNPKPWSDMTEAVNIKPKRPES